MVAFVGSLIVAFGLTGVVVAYGKRRPVGAPLSWGQAMTAATFVFFLLFWAYGVVPHQWLNWADNELNWRSDAYLIGPGATTLENAPVAVTLAAVKDTVAVVIYGVFLGIHVAMWAIWQARGERAESRRKAIAEQTTTYGRPLVRRT